MPSASKARKGSLPPDASNQCGINFAASSADDLSVPHPAHIARRRSTLARLTIAVSLLAAPALTQAQKQPLPLAPHPSTQAIPLPTLTTLRQVHSLSLAESRRGYPVHVQAVVTYYDAHLDPRRIALFLHDSTGSVYAGVPLETSWAGRSPLPGTLVDVRGVSAPGDFAPIIDNAQIAILGRQALPAPGKPIALAQLLTGTYDAQWVQIQGVVHSVLETQDNVTLKVATDDGLVPATTVRRPGIDYRSMVDKWTTIRGNVGPLFNASRQLTGIRIFFPGMQTITAVAPDSGNVFDRPVKSADSLLRFDPGVSWPHRVHLRGAVTLFWPGRTICISDSTGGLCAQTAQTDPIAVGSTVDLAGFTVLSDIKPTLSDAIFRPASGSLAAPVQRVSPAGLLKGTYDSELVQVTGRLIGRDLSAGDNILVLSSAGSVFRAILQPGTAVPAIRNGSTLRLTGICSVQVDAQRTLADFGMIHGSQFSILLPSPAGIVVLKSPPWWTGRRIGIALLLLLAVAVAASVWVFVLRRRVEQQTRELRESRELYRHMAHHDALTGLATRTLLRDRLENALERARRFGKTSALLMLDLDRFKEINDYYGHGTGDQVLQVTAERIRAAIRKTDSIARLGGDEFIILLNDLADGEQVELIAAKIVSALAVPIWIGKFEVPVSVSVGVCTLADGSVGADLLLRRVDIAMYRAKARGRNCFQLFTSDMSDSDPAASHHAGSHSPPVTAA